VKKPGYFQGGFDLGDPTERLQVGTNQERDQLQGKVALRGKRPKTPHLKDAGGGMLGWVADTERVSTIRPASRAETGARGSFGSNPKQQEGIGEGMARVEERLRRRGGGKKTTFLRTNSGDIDTGLGHDQKTLVQKPSAEQK